MAGDWIKIEAITPDKPELIRMAASLRIDQDAVFGKLFRVWAWADQNSVDGSNLIVTESFLDRLANKKGFAAAMRAAAWLTGEDGALCFPNFDRHNGKTAKTRAETNRRMVKLRVLQKSDAGSVTNRVTKSVTREEKRREESTDPKPEEPAGSLPAGEPPDSRRRGEPPILPTLDQAKEAAPLAGIDPAAAECWWLDCDSRGISPNGFLIDRNGAEIRNWRSAMTSFGRRWQSNERAGAGRKKGAPSGWDQQPKFTPGDDKL